MNAARVSGRPCDLPGPSLTLRINFFRCVLDEMESIPNIAKMRFRPADLVMLNLVKRTTLGNRPKA